MKNLVSLLILLSSVTFMLVACGTVLKTVKPDSEPASSTAAKSDSEKTADAKSRTLSPQQTKDKLTTRSADLAQSGLPDADLSSSSGDGMALRAEVNQSALEFAKNFPDVIAVKTCYSKLYGGWNLDLFERKGKKIDRLQFSWNNKSKEWDTTAKVPVEHADKIEFYLNTELSDEKCFVLKK
jgi:hypothetical protein